MQQQQAFKKSNLHSMILGYKDGINKKKVCTQKDTHLQFLV